MLYKTKKLSVFIFTFTILLVSCSKEKRKITSQQVPPKMNVKDSIRVKDTLSTVQYDVYCNSQFNYCITYPSAFLIPQGEMKDGEGQTFLAPAQKAELRIYRDPRTLFLSANYELEEVYNEDRAEEKNTQKQITSETFNTKCFTLSGNIADKKFYQKTLMTQYNLVTAILTYDESEKHIYEQLVKPIFDSMQ